MMIDCCKRAQLPVTYRFVVTRARPRIRNAQVPIIQYTAVICFNDVVQQITDHVIGEI